jgi:uncharacterized protein
MTPDERALLQNFLRDLQNTQGVGKDPEADAMINQALGGSPTAAYVLVQHAILSDQALHAAQQQIATLQAQLQQQPAPQPTSFLGGQPAQQPGPWSAPAQPMPQAAPQSPGFMGPGPFRSGGGLGSFLRSAGTTAAGVAGGALLFEGVSSLFGGHGFGGGQPTENITNNYYDDDNDDGGSNDDGGDYDDSGSDDN